MTALADLFLERSAWLLGSPASQTTRRLALMAGLGSYGAGSRELSESFRELGVLHLLVLSGSQVGHFLSKATLPLALLPSPRAHPFFRRCVLVAVTALAAWTYGHATGWQPALTRALILGILYVIAPAPVLGWREVLAFALQIAIFPAHAEQRGFYMSWVCYLTLKIVEARFEGAFARAVALGAICQLVVLPFVPASASLATWALATVANVLVGWVFEVAVMPVVGWVLASGFWSSCALGAGAWAVSKPALAGIARPALEGAGGAVLVALRAFRYI